MSTAPPPADRLDCYEVGGAVRDALLGLPVHDRDWVVVGATPQQMEALGFRPVGRDFPVFLHPRTQEEFALARTERKSGLGYRGFVVQCAPEVTLEEDLARRDLTINAMARAADGRLIDPYGGERDLRAGIFRHVSAAFSEDPVRILRTARFAARFERFTVAPETLALMQGMVQAGEVDALVPERVWQELARGLACAHPSRMVEVLHDCGALARIAPELAMEPDEGRLPARLAILDAACRAGVALPLRFAILAALGWLDLAPAQRADQASAIASRLKAPNDCRELAVMAAREHEALRPDAAIDDAAGVLQVLERCDALRKPERFEALLQVRAWLAGGPTVPASHERLRAALAAVRALDAGAIASRLNERGCAAQIVAALRSARTAAVAAALSGR